MLEVQECTPPVYIKYLLMHGFFTHELMIVFKSEDRFHLIYWCNATFLQYIITLLFMAHRVCAVTLVFVLVYILAENENPGILLLK